jgi:hypothetical protein
MPLPNKVRGLYGGLKGDNENTAALRFFEDVIIIINISV